MPSARMARPRAASKRTASSLADRTRPGSVREAISQWGAVVLRVAISAPPAGPPRGSLLHGALLEEDCDAGRRGATLARRRRERGLSPERAGAATSARADGRRPRTRGDPSLLAAQL